MTRAYRLGVMLGDGIGPEIVPASVRVVDAAPAAARDRARGRRAATELRPVREGLPGGGGGLPRRRSRHGDDRALDAAVRGGVSTGDLGGTASTDRFTAAVIVRIPAAI
ncbi:MAG: 3-isopropylmalate dehydrogenase [Blastococcus sp.]|jgi:isocitrate/isopropylmalate dehydrogenase|nr:3-isopropylmalate dehydrogenase [Blastococcus sp.]